NNQLRFERRTQIEQIFAELRKLRRGVIPRMLDDAFAHFKRKIEAGKIQVALLKMLDDAQGMQIVIEVAAMGAHQFVEPAFPRMSERRMANVVNQSERFGQFRV